MVSDLPVVVGIQRRSSSGVTVGGQCRLECKRGAVIPFQVYV